MSASSEDSCELSVGYVETCVDRWKLDSRFFPSKVGGYPAWLDFNIPDAEDLKCRKCGNPCIFLCQVYAPIEEQENCFHRTIFIFLCLSPDCCENNTNVNLKVFRCQLPRKNAFYPYDPPVYEENWCKEICASTYCKLCIVCGCKSTSHCAKCKKANYCSRQHQVSDWKAGHKEVCEVYAESNVVVAKSELLLPEFELLVGAEAGSSDSSSSSPSDEENGEETSTSVDKVEATFQGNSQVDEDLLRMARSEQSDDRTFHHFKKCTNRHPRQVLRYDRGGEPLWIASVADPLTVPPCQYCGADRKFEFQILPQLLNHLGLDSCERSVDWGTLAVFTCAASCDMGPPYKAEFVWKQDLS
ncbi:programmed cell death protein 2-like [Schistocerca gregaria]|uniref:programmed cell death protein 2-like n=1 Tax=Schistocerca gregaria TaxID=7010 RepID=UPI00211E6E88|nr:programmed cell death protein 2-like [Schistocerca gregaria]